MQWVQQFTKKEVEDLLIASLIVGFIAHLFLDIRFGHWALNWFVGVLIAGASYAVHEIAHKLYAESLKYRAEFRIDWKWALASLFASIFSWVMGMGFLILAVGSVVIHTTKASTVGKKYQRMTKNEAGKIAFIGPASNVGLAVFFKILSPIHPIFSVAALLNLWLALFNTMPIPPLDGLAIFSWSIIPWSILFSTEIMLLALIDIAPLAYIIPLLLGVWLFLFVWLQKHTKVKF